MVNSLYNPHMADGVSLPTRVQVVDSHTAGEPTRVVIAGGPPLSDDGLQSRVEILRSRYDSFRKAVLYEPRGSEVIVGALLCAPHDPTAAAGVIFFNDVSYLGMCGHGTIGLVTTLAHIGRIKPGKHKIELNGQLVATFKQKFRFFTKEAVLDLSPGGDKLDPRFAVACALLALMKESAREEQK